MEIDGNFNVPQCFCGRRKRRNAADPLERCGISWRSKPTQHWALASKSGQNRKTIDANQILQLRTRMNMAAHSLASDRQPDSKAQTSKCREHDREALLGIAWTTGLGCVRYHPRFGRRERLLLN